MVNTSALESRGRGFKSRSRQFLEFHLCSFISFFHWFQFICVMYIYIYIYFAQIPPRILPGYACSRVSRAYIARRMHLPQHLLFRRRVSPFGFFRAQRLHSIIVLFVVLFILLRSCDEINCLIKLFTCLQPSGGRLNLLFYAHCRPRALMSLLTLV